MQGIKWLPFDLKGSVFLNIFGLIVTSVHQHHFDILTYCEHTLISFFILIIYKVLLFLFRLFILSSADDSFSHSRKCTIAKSQIRFYFPELLLLVSNINLGNNSISFSTVPFRKNLVIIKLLLLWLLLLLILQVQVLFFLLFLLILRAILVDSVGLIGSRDSIVIILLEVLVEHCTLTEERLLVGWREHLVNIMFILFLDSFFLLNISTIVALDCSAPRPASTACIRVAQHRLRGEDLQQGRCIRH
jgi:hypothetical protein